MALNLDALGKKIGPVTKDYTWKDTVLYALGVGAGFEELQYCYENQLKVIPTFSIGAVFDFLAEVALTAEVNLAGILHGEQEIKFLRPIPKEGQLITEGVITNYYDKGEGKGALVVAKADTFHSNAEKIFSNVFTLFSRLDGGFGGEPLPSAEFVFPDRDPDFEQIDHPPADQPLLYRLSGDVFSLHVDPDFAKASGFEKPIMHGLCTFGYACRALVNHLMNSSPESMKRIKIRFSKPLYPGVKIKTQIWKTGTGKALYRTLNADSGEVVLDRGEVEWMSDEEVKENVTRAGIRFDDQVAVVTGAGGGLGRAYALELARRGAKVVVNDLGGTTSGGDNSSNTPADKVVEEIKALGSEAIANYASVATIEGGKSIIDAAIQAFGRVDILINNAGILRDKTLAKMAQEDWEQVMAVHLGAAYNVTRPALVEMKKQNYGRIVMTTSAAGLFGNFGQTNYSTAKLALIGFMNTLKHEGRNNNILVNTVAPVALTRLTGDVLPAELADRLKPEYVVPIVAYLCSERCPVSGHVYTAGGGHFSRAAVVSGAGVVLKNDELPPSVEQVSAKISKIRNLDSWQEVEDATAFLGQVLGSLSAPQDGSGSASEDDSKLTVAEVFDKMTDAFSADQASGVDVVFQYKISGESGGEWFVTVKDQACQVESGLAEKPTTTIIMNQDDFLSMMGGKLNPMQAYTSGKLKIEGDLMKSQLIEKLFSF